MKEHDALAKTKSQWNRPVLTVLVRNQPEEGVLTACKGRMVAAGPRTDDGACSQDCEVWCHNSATS